MNNLGEGVRLLDSIHETWTHTITTTITIIRKQKRQANIGSLFSSKDLVKNLVMAWSSQNRNLPHTDVKQFGLYFSGYKLLPSLCYICIFPPQETWPVCIDLLKILTKGWIPSVPIFISPKAFGSFFDCFIKSFWNSACNLGKEDWFKKKILYIFLMPLLRFTSSNISSNNHSLSLILTTCKFMCGLLLFILLVDTVASMSWQRPSSNSVHGFWVFMSSRFFARSVCSLGIISPTISISWFVIFPSLCIHVCIEKTDKYGHFSQ